MMYVGVADSVAESPYTAVIRRVAGLANVPAELLAAHAMAESSFNPAATHTDADGGTSYGLMQVRLDTARRLLQQPALTPQQLLDPYFNLLAGARVIQENLVRWKTLPDAIAAYNAGVPRKNAAGQYTNSRGNTMVQTYVDRVLGYLRQYQDGATIGPLRPAIMEFAIPGMLILGGSLALFAAARR